MAVITISRQSGSSGNEIAQLLSQKLGYRLFDKAMLLQLVKELQLATPQAEVSSEQHYHKSLLERILNPFDRSSEPGHVYQRDFSVEEDSLLSITQVKNIILAAHHHSDIVIVGRGSQVVLAGLPDVLHVRVIAPLEQRIKTWQQRENLSYKEAQKLVHERDSAHVDFVKNFFDTDLRDPGLYDLVVNTAKLPPPSAVDIIIKALHTIEPPG